MPTVFSSIVESDPMGVAGNFDGKDVRLALLGNTLPGLFARGDFAVSQRAAGANMSVDIAQGRAFIDPRSGGSDNHQGVYLARRTNAAAFNTLVDGVLTWTASDPSNPRIDILGIQLYDQGEGDPITGWKFAVQVGTPAAGATHQLEAQLWPAIPQGFLPLAAVHRPAGSTTITNAQITNLNPIGGGRAVASSNPTVDTVVVNNFTRLGTPDIALVYVPHAAARVRFGFKGQWKHSAGTQSGSVTLFVDGVRGQMGDASGGSDVYQADVTLTTSYSPIQTSQLRSSGPGDAGFYGSPSSAADVVDGNTLGVNGVGVAVGGWSPIELFGLSAGWHTLELRFARSNSGTLSVRNRFLWAEVVG